MEDLEIVLYMFFRLDIDPILTMIRPGLDQDQDPSLTKIRVFMGAEHTYAMARCIAHIPNLSSPV